MDGLTHALVLLGFVVFSIASVSPLLSWNVYCEFGAGLAFFSAVFTTTGLFLVLGGNTSGTTVIVILAIGGYSLLAVVLISFVGLGISVFTVWRARRMLGRVGLEAKRDALQLESRPSQADDIDKLLQPMLSEKSLAFDSVMRLPAARALFRENLVGQV